jgi:hypothetical protein
MYLNDSVIGSHPIEKQSSGIVEAENNFASEKRYQMMAERIIFAQAHQEKRN